jgi:copper chaperone NosL
MAARLLAAVAGLALLASCAVEPRPVHLGADECAHCRMAIEDTRFAAQLLTDRGRSEVFDAIECLATAIAEGTYAGENIHSLWVMDSVEGGAWVRVEEAHFVHSSEIRSPMGMGVAAFADRHDAEIRRAELGGGLLDWDGVLLLASSGGPHGHAH